MDLNTVLLEHMEKSRLACVIQTKKENFRIFMVETCEGRENKHESENVSWNHTRQSSKSPREPKASSQLLYTG